MIESAERIAVLTGAGISTDSGIPDFRGPRGVWTLDSSAEATTNINSYMTSVEVRRRCWSPGGLNRLGNAKPNVAHEALVRLEQTGKLLALVTQNVDGLHQAAGSSPDLVVEAHGNVRFCECCFCADKWPMEHALKKVAAGDLDPSCDSCGGPLKAAVVFFGEMLKERDITRFLDAAWDCDLLIAIGTTLQVPPVCTMVPEARNKGAKIMIINGQSTVMDSKAHMRLRGPIGEILPQLM